MKENNKPSLLILCPCFNEMQTIESSIDKLLQTLADLGEKDLINYISFKLFNAIKLFLYIQVIL